MQKLLIIILVLATVLRLYGLNWDQGQHLHPDERMIAMVVERIHLPQTGEEMNNLFTIESPLNPQFFAYGSFPIYLLKITGSMLGNFDPKFATYEKINLVGRGLSAFFDIGTLIILYLLARKLFHQKVALIAAFFYGVSVLPIQLSHFYAVDTPLTFFTIFTLYQVIRFYEKPSRLNALLLGILFGFSLATKISAILLILPIILTYFLTYFSKPFPLLLRKLLPVFFLTLLLTTFSTLITYFILQPFTFIDFQTFWRQTLEQQAMTRDAFTFPYTLQYVGKIPYLYELQNIFFWGLGPILATLSFTGVLYLTYKTFFLSFNSKFLILNSFFFVYFLIVGRFAIGFMRYMLPIYPLLILSAAFVLNQLISYLKSYFINHKSLFLIPASIFFILIFIWPLSFISIYSKPNTRTQASEWIYQNIPPFSKIAREHWDDGLPLEMKIPYQILELPMYEPDSSSLKWAKVNQVLQNTDYIIIASNRLYTPLMKLSDCNKLPPGRCYLKTAQYYQQLFNGSLGFQKIAEFSVYPNLEFRNWKLEFSDEVADESFTVYDHPKIMIFQKRSSP